MIMKLDPTHAQRMKQLHPKESKYKAKKTIVDEITFDSKREADYYQQLKILKMAGEITDIQLQPKYLLVDSYRHPTTGKKVQPAHYVADFLVTYPDGRTEVIDVKGMKTPLYKFKKKLFESKYGIAIREVG